VKTITSLAFFTLLLASPDTRAAGALPESWLIDGVIISVTAGGVLISCRALHQRERRRQNGPRVFNGIPAMKKANEQWEKSKEWSKKTGLTEVRVQLTLAGCIGQESRKIDQLESRLRWVIEGRESVLEQRRIDDFGNYLTSVLVVPDLDACELLLHIKIRKLAQALPAVKKMLADEGVLNCARIDVADYDNGVFYNYYPHTRKPSLEALRRARGEHCP
jgi:hypothetical protein